MTSKTAEKYVALPITHDGKPSIYPVVNAKKIKQNCVSRYNAYYEANDIATMTQCDAYVLKRHHSGEYYHRVARFNSDGRTMRYLDSAEGKIGNCPADMALASIAMPT